MTTYTYSITDFPNQKVNSDRLIAEITKSAITVALDCINTDPSYVFIIFKDVLSVADRSTLDAIVVNHSGEPLPSAPQIVKAQILTEAPYWIESNNALQELYAAESILLDVLSGVTETSTKFSFPYNIGVKSATIYVTDDMVGDQIIVHEGPNTLIGYLTSPINSGDTVIYVSDTVIQNIKIGYYVDLYVPGDDEGIEIGQVIDINTNDRCLTIHTPSQISADTDSYLSMCGKLIPRLDITCNQKIEIGKTIPTASRLPKNIPIRIIYKNNNGKAKKVSIFVEYIY